MRGIQARKQEIERVARRIDNNIYRNHLKGQDQKVTTLMIEEAMQESEIFRNTKDANYQKGFNGICRALGVTRKELSR